MMARPDHLLTSEEQAFLNVLARFAATELGPRAAAVDREGLFVHDQIAALADLGMMGANLPETACGPGLSPYALCEAVAVIAGACASTASALTAHYLASDSILIVGTEAQKDTWLPRAASGQALGAFALTEPGAGSNPADMTTHAQATKTGWHLKGEKTFISNAAHAEFIVVYAKTDPGAGHRGISAFLVEKGMAGLQIGPPEPTMGLKGGHVFPIRLDCHLPATSLLGQEGQGFRTAMKVLDNGRIEVAAMCLGIAGAALDAAKTYAAERQIGGTHLSDFQGLSWMLADMDTDLAAARALTLDAARCRAMGTGQARAAAQAKLFASEMAARVTDKALQIHGGYGYSAQLPLERYVRDVRIMRIYEGSSEIQRNIIAAHLMAARKDGS